MKYDSRLIEFSKREHKSPQVLAINPRGQVPAFKDGDVVVNESLAAIQYLDQTYPDPPLKGLNPQVLQRMSEVNNLQTAVRGVLMAQRQQASKEELESKIGDLKTELKFWESYLGSSSHLVGSDFTLADVAFAPFLLAVDRSSAEFTDFPNLAKYIAQVKGRPSIDQSWPPHWRETPKLEILKGYI